MNVPDCPSCNDTRNVRCDDAFWRFCSSCQKPCERCEGESRTDGMITGTGYCAKPPCRCACHVTKEAA